MGRRRSKGSQERRWEEEEEKDRELTSPHGRALGPEPEEIINGRVPPTDRVRRARTR